MDKQQHSVFWFRRDLRLTDNAGLYYALKSGLKVLPIFIFDQNILDKLEDKDDARVTFIHQQLRELNTQLQEFGSSIIVKYGTPTQVWENILNTYNVAAVYTNHDYEPYAKERDEKLLTFFAQKNIQFHTYKDQCIFEKSEVVKDDGKPYVVFTPYKRKWLEKLQPYYTKAYPTEKYFENFVNTSKLEIPSLEEMGFTQSKLPFPDKVYQDILKNYSIDRDFPAKEATSQISVHLRFGTISIRELVKKSMDKSEVWLSELIWRDFYFSILWHFPHSAKNSFRPEYDKIKWRNNEHEFKAWCDGKTGYAIVDAGMRQLNQTGFMHNRIRMVVASFLTKHLLIDWRWGEHYFARKLLDFELSSNVGGWQWAAGCGVDAAPYFRIFNPYEQVKKFDKDLRYIKKWVPEFSDPFKYPKPIVDHKVARERCLATYKEALK
ncbi:cryptochrome/photolyase family protein [Pedobacter cryophilus]|uniref:Deoxyribodipyrimidine photo-lyase n=1 Tax=Pedobacter cryophilus TaxID=2571271 RepID=A0A4U1C9F3_9SPHI|nr:deoxyribodipyrimidine photo-lyase [Pedobacter cryophilus]TKC01047.1 deoxyribodipyrimidine photo-lyase [Pedobacter cryophilus]